MSLLSKDCPGLTKICKYATVIHLEDDYFTMTREKRARLSNDLLQMWHLQIEVYPWGFTPNGNLGEVWVLGTQAIIKETITYFYIYSL